LKRPFNQEQRSLFLLLSVLSFFVLTPLLEGNPTGEAVLVISLYLTLVSATLEVSVKRRLLWGALPLAVSSMVLLVASRSYRTRPLALASDVVLAAFLALVSVALFMYLGRPGAITKGRLFVSVAVYLLMGLGWYVLYGIINTLQPGSFAEAGASLSGKIPASKLLYFSMVSLTTLGYGDIVAVRPAARMLAALEATAGVLYIAITVARLVAGYQISDRK